MGARDDYGDGIGSLSTTAVLIKTPATQSGQPAWTYRPSRVDVLLFLVAGQSRRTVVDFFLTLYADDGSAARSPGIQVRQRRRRRARRADRCSHRPPSLSPCPQLSVPWSLRTVVTSLSSVRGTWVQVDVSGAGWPILSPNTYYWVVLTPGSPLSLASGNGVYDGVLWSGISDAPGSPLPSSVVADRNLFTGRQLVSQSLSGDATFGANTAAAVAFLQGSTAWAGYGAPRYTNWQASGSRVRYGIHVVGYLATPSATPTASGEWGRLGAVLFGLLRDGVSLTVRSVAVVPPLLPPPIILVFRVLERESERVLLL